MLSLVAVLALCMQVLAPYLVWRDRWNIPTHLSAGFCMTAYIIPGFFTGVWDKYPADTVNFFIQINVVGAIILCAGTLLGSYFVRMYTPYIPPTAPPLPTNSAPMIRRVVILITICVLGMCAAYAIMGFIPMFAADPFSAKQFKGVYRDPYYRAAYLFRFSFSVLQAAIPLILAVGWYKRSPYLIFLAVAAFAVLVVSLARGAAATGVLFFFGILAARNSGMKWYLPLVIVIFPFGSISYYLLGQLLHIQALQTVNTGDTLAQFIADGAPDIMDQLTWFNGFIQGDYFSWGRTLFAGLIPSNFPWNPQVWTLTYYDVGADITEMVTGGLRLTTAEWGYANFGWFGVVIIPLISGLLSGAMVQKLKTLLPRLTLLQGVAALLVYATLGQFIFQWYIVSIHALPALAAMLYFWRANGISINGTPLRRRRPLFRQSGTTF